MNMSFEPPAKDVTISEMGTLLSCTTAAREEDKNSASVRRIYMLHVQHLTLCYHLAILLSPIDFNLQI